MWLLWLGSGVIGGLGLGLGYISPVSTLVKWFPDRRGMATGMAIMGFGGGAMIGAPLANLLMNYFKTPTDVGVWQTFLAMAAIYFFFMLIGAFRYRIPPAGWRPEGWTPPAKSNAMISQHNVHLKDAHKTPQFWLIWWVLCLNVSAGIGVIGMASPMLQEIFAGKLIGHPELGFNALSGDQQVDDRGDRCRFRRSPFAVQHRRTVLLGLTVRLHRAQEHLLHVLRARHHLLSPDAMVGEPRFESGIRGRRLHHPVDVWRRFRNCAGYLADMFGTQFVGAIHGRLLTAWSTAGIIGPVVVNYIREAQLAAGVPRDHLYDYTLYILAGMLVIGLICNYLIKPVDKKWYMTAEEVAKLQAASAKTAASTGSHGIGFGGLDAKAAAFWAFVGIPLAWGVWTTLVSAAKIF